MLKKGFLGVIALAVALIFSLSPVQAAPIIDFSDGTAKGGVLVHSGSNISGTGVGIDILTVLNTPNYVGPTSFDLSGAFVGGVNGTAAVLDFDTGISSNFIRITGGVTIGSTVIPDNTVLLEGSFVSFNIFDNGVNLSISNARGPDIKDSELLTALGLQPNSPFNFFGFSISAKNTGNQFIAYSTDISNSGKVPEPISLILLGSGLAGAGLYRRMRKPRG